MTIVEFLLARIVEDESIARSARREDAPEWSAVERPRTPMGRRWDVPAASAQIGPSIDALNHVLRFQPDRVISECKTKRTLIERFVNDPDFDNYPLADIRDQTLQTMASVYADHPDYDQAWA